MTYSTRDIDGHEADYYFERQREARADRAAAQRPTNAPARLVATICKGDYGLWFVRLTGSGYPNEQHLDTPHYAERYLTQRVEDGYTIVDPDGYCDTYGVLTDGAVSQYEDARDVAEAPVVAMVGRGAGDDGRGAVAAELDF